jgi:uncharacterized protein (TIGR03435 family)
MLDEQTAIVTLQEERAAQWPAWVLAAWAALCLFRLSQIGRSYVYLRGVKRRAAVSQSALPTIERPARLLLSSDVASPMAVGFLHPAVILPESLPGELAQPEMEHVLLHEAAHIARRDDWTNLLARLLGAALALHPVAWWILRQIEREREIACDDWVVARVGSARPYAESLARMSELRWARQAKLSATHGKTQGEALASGMFGGGSRLGERIELLLERGRVFSPQVSRGRVGVSGVALIGCVVAGGIAPRLIAFAQGQSFEAVSIRLNPSSQFGVGYGGMRFNPAGIDCEGVYLIQVIAEAYQIPFSRISGADARSRGMLQQEQYNIAAKAEHTVSRNQLRLMLQGMLAERFKLTLHHESKTEPVYRLTVGKGGTKLKRLETDGQGAPSMNPVADSTTFHNYTMARFAAVLSNYMGRAVLDQTDLDGIYEDFTLTLDGVIPPNKLTGGSVSWASSSIFADIQKQLGLKLDADKAPVDYFVVDHVEKPDAN